jgi:acyl carrier protein
MIADRIRRFIVEELRRDAAGNVAPDASLIDDGIIDSVGIVRMVAFLEREFRIRIDDDEVLPRNFETIDAMAAFVGRKGGLARRPAS